MNLFVSIRIYITTQQCRIENQPIELQMELCELQTDLELISSSHTNGIHFWKTCSAFKYPKLTESMLRFLSMFGSTYSCEQNFSTMNIIKNKYRSRLTEVNLETLLRISTTNIEIDFDLLVQ